MTVPQKEIDELSPIVKDLFLQWRDFLYSRVTFNMPDSEIHAAGHCERVLLYALIIGHEIFGGDPYVLTALAHAAVFHDTRRQDDYLDTGHGARAAVYYRQFCDETPDIDFIPEALLMMKYHDIDDMRGKVGIKRDFYGSLPRMLMLYDIFKDADALDRWRLGSGGLDPKYLRTRQAKAMLEYSHRIVDETISKEQRRRIDEIFEKLKNKEQ